MNGIQYGNRCIGNECSIDKMSSYLREYPTGYFTPTDYDLIAWYKMEPTSITYDANGISKVNDLSGNDYHLLQAVDANKPAFLSVNSIGTSVYDGANTFMNVDFGVTHAQPFTIFLLFKTIVNVNQFVYDSFSSIDRNFMYMWSDDKIHYSAGVELTYSKVKPFNYIVSCVIPNGVNSTVYENGVSKITGNLGARSISGITLGASYIPSAFFNGSIAEMFIIDGVLSTADRQLFESYLNDKRVQLIG